MKQSTKTIESELNKQFKELHLVSFNKQQRSPLEIPAELMCKKIIRYFEEQQMKFDLKQRKKEKEKKN